VARSETRTLLSLDRFARVLGANPLHFNGVVHDLAPATTCGQPLMQYDWQTADGVSREAIALAIADAEARISEYLKFKPLPVFEVDERHSIGRPLDPTLFAYKMVGAGYQSIATEMDWGHLVAGGIEQRTAIALNAVVTYSDDDGDGYKEKATLTIGTTVTDPNEIALFMPGESGAPEFEVRPIKVTISGGSATIVARREQLVIPDLFERLDSNKAIDGSNDANFLPTADVYRIWHDPSQQVQFLWENNFGSCGCGISACPTCFLSAQFGCTTVRDYRLGLITGQPAVWNDVTLNFESTYYAIGRSPDRARFWYRAGYRDKTRARPFQEMDLRYERAIAAYAVTFLDRPFCGCDNVENITNRWKEDLAKVSPEVGTSRLSAKWLDNPLGTTQGALHAWRLIRNQALGEAA